MFVSFVFDVRNRTECTLHRHTHSSVNAAMLVLFVLYEKTCRYEFDTWRHTNNVYIIHWFCQLFQMTQFSEIFLISHMNVYCICIHCRLSFLNIIRLAPRSLSVNYYRCSFINSFYSIVLLDDKSESFAVLIWWAYVFDSIPFRMLFWCSFRIYVLTCPISC